jgi:nucleotide-binding universal stress UspA family protein
MELPLVVGVDGSEGSLRAVDWAVTEAARRGTSLRVVHASLWERYEGHNPVFSAAHQPGGVLAERIVDAAVERARLRDPAVKVTGEALTQEPVPALVREGHGASALVVGCRGRGELAGMLLGSVSMAAASHADCPVIVVRGEERNLQDSFRRVVLGVSGDRDETAAVVFALAEAGLRDSTLEAVHAWRRPANATADVPLPYAEVENEYLRGAEKAMEDALREPVREYPGVTVRREIVEGQTRKALLHAASSADLLVLGARRAGSRFGMQLGLVNHALLHHAPCPVAIVPQPAPK